MRIRGRLQLSELVLDYASKDPVILPKCAGSESLVRFSHYFLNRGGVPAMMTYVRNSYYVFGLRCLAKAVKKRCFPCQRWDAKASNERASILPAERVTRAPIFSVSGFDF